MYVFLFITMPPQAQVTPPHHQVKVQCPYLAQYEVAWPVKLLMAQYLDNHRDRVERERRRNEAANQNDDAGGPLAAGAPPNTNAPGGAGPDDEGTSDVNVSDID